MKSRIHLIIRLCSGRKLIFNPVFEWCSKTGLKQDKTWGRFHKLFLRPTPLGPTFAPVKSFSKSWASFLYDLRLAPSFNEINPCLKPISRLQ